MQATERNFCISCNESIKRGRTPCGETWANPSSVFARFAGQHVSARLRHLSWLSPSSASQPRTGLTGSGAAEHWGRLGQCAQRWQMELVRLLMGGRIFPPLMLLWCRDLLQVRFASDFLVLLWLPCPSMRDELPKCDGTRRDSPAGEVPLLGCTRAPQCPQGPKAVFAALGKDRLSPWHTQDPSLAATAKFSH